jgi:hypothetical protein
MLPEINDYLVLGALIGIYIKTSGVIMQKVACPEHLQPKNTKGKRTKDYFDYYGNYFSMVHAITSLIFSVYALSQEGLTFGTPVKSWTMKIVAYNSLAYFISDTILASIYGYLDAAMIVHHVASVICSATVFFSQSCGAEQALGLIIGESSNPFNLTREILKHQKKDKSNLYLQMSVGFIVTFVGCRFIIAPFFIAKLYAAPTLFIFKLMIALVWFVSFHWLFMIINFGVKAVRDALEGDAKSGKSGVFTTAYAILSKLRKNKAFMAAYYLGTAWLSFGTLYLAHGSA